ncbi:hypothetical protein N0B44_18705 [Roseibacterium beibuensis]|uniref:HEPN-associated N-terminal domain-containing protein n=1 Tax=[Roseibacterium] beibuensis TaxID=1193142 RepID=UPI00217EC6AB|nr:HEPN-associated N-terminal domain-containing protein [Roseibacterium beibuensis]MCS6624948.1 hypothetical protein [Roseibacterium beibuensis]
MSINASGVALIRHADTGEVYRIEPDELDWDEVAGDERQMGVEVAHEATINHPELGLLSWTLWEYPLGMENDREVDIGPHQMLEAFQFDLADGAEAPGEREDLIRRMVEWFHENFEDPANSMPYVSAEGGYQWVEGPYHARDELHDEFPAEDEDIIEAAAREIESDGIVDWAPTHWGDDENQDDEAQLNESQDEFYRDQPITGLQSMAARADEHISDEELSRRLLRVARPASGPLFAPNADGQVDLAAWTVGDQPDADLLVEVRDASVALVRSLAGTNAHTAVLAQAERYREAVAEHDISIARIYARGIVLENTGRAANDLARDGDQPHMPAPTRRALQSLLQLHGALIMTSQEGRRLAGAANEYRRPVDTQEALAQATIALSDALQDRREVATAVVREAVQEAVAQVSQGPRPERSNQIAGMVLAGALAGIAHVAMESSTGLVVSAVLATGAGMAAQAGLTGGFNAALQFLADNVQALEVYAAVAVQDAAWLRPLVVWVRSKIT